MATGGVYRLIGTGLDRDQEVEWSLILKVLSLTPAGKASAADKFAIFAALKYGCFLHWLYQIVDEDRHASWTRRTGHSLDECLQNQATLIYYLLDLADEARHLLHSM